MEEHNEKEVQLVDFWTILKRCWILVLVVLIVGTVGCYAAWKAVHEDEFQSTAKIYVLSNAEELQQGNTSSPMYQIQIANYLIDDCQELFFVEDNVLRPVLTKLNLDSFGMTTKDLKNMIKVEAVGDTRVLRITVTSSDAAKSREICNVFTAQACEYFNGLHTDGTWDIVQVADSAKLQSEPSNPISLLIVLSVGVLLALAVYAIFFIRFLLDDKINNSDDVAKYLDVSVLGVIPNKYDSRRRRAKYGAYYGSSEKKEGRTRA